MFKGLSISMLLSVSLIGGHSIAQVVTSEKAGQATVKKTEEKKIEKDDSAIVSVDKEIKVTAAVEKEVGHGSSFAIEVEYENVQTRKKYVTAYSVEVEVKTPYWKQKGYDHDHSGHIQSMTNDQQYYIIPKFEIHLTPYKRQILGNGIPDADLRNALVIGKTEIKRSGELFNITVFGLGAEFSREYEVISPRLRLILEMGLHTLGYRNFQRGDKLGNFTGFEIIGAYPGAEMQFDLSKKYTLSFSVEDDMKVSAAQFQKPLVENTFSSKFKVKTKFKEGFLKHLDSVWYKQKNRNNSPGTFESEKAHEFGVTWKFGKSRQVEDTERCTLTEEEKSKGWKCINP